MGGDEAERLGGEGAMRLGEGEGVTEVGWIGAEASRLGGRRGSEVGWRGGSEGAGARREDDSKRGKKTAKV